jgi:murein DD-endopeptidase MepM/ murein hydrolase activator NlpD
MPRATVVKNGHTDKNGLWIEYEQIPRRSGRPDSYLAYRFPVVGARVVSGYDLDKPDDEQRRGTMSAVGHGGVDFAAEMDAPVTMVRLEHQVGDAEVLYVGWLFGETVVTRNTVREGGADRDYVVLFGHLDAVADGVRRGRRLPEGALVGLMGNTGSPQHVHLHLEARRVREGTDAWTLPGEMLDAREYSVVSDPRNVLPLREAPRHARQCSFAPSRPRPRYWLGEAMKLVVPWERPDQAG